MIHEQKSHIKSNNSSYSQSAENALYSVQTQLAINNFPISGQSMPTVFIKALLQIKATAAVVNASLGELPIEIGQAINQAVDVLLDKSHFVLHNLIRTQQ